MKELFKNNLKRITKKYDYSELKKYDQYHQVEFTGFFNSNNEGCSGRNGMNTICNFETRLTECRNIHFVRGYSMTHLKIYMETTIRDAKSFIYLELKDSKNRDCLHLPTDFHSKEDAKKWLDNHKYEMQGYRGIGGLDKILSDMCYGRWGLHSFYLNDSGNSPFVSFLKAFLNIKRYFKYNKELCVSNISKFKETKNTLQIIFKSMNTYESRMFELKFKRSIVTNVTSLRDIDGETSGYYTHSEGLCIPTAQLDDAKKFIKRVNKAA